MNTFVFLELVFQAGFNSKFCLFVCLLLLFAMCIMVEQSTLHLRRVQRRAAGGGGGRTLKDDAQNHAEKRQRFREDENEHNANVHLRLLRRTTHTGVTNDTNRHAGGQAAQTTAQTGGEIGETVGQRIKLLLHCNQGNKEE
jgi:hypothetical protein